MDTQFTDSVFFFLGGPPYRYKLNSFNPAAFENRFTKEELDRLMDKIYKKTDNFQSREKLISLNKKWGIANIMLIVMMLFLLIVSFQNFKKNSTIAFLVFASLIGLYYLYLVVQSCRLRSQITNYEKSIVEILSEKNKEMLEQKRGMKFTVMKEYILIILHADYLREKNPVKLTSGSRDLHLFYNHPSRAIFAYGTRVTRQTPTILPPTQPRPTITAPLQLENIRLNPSPQPNQPHQAEIPDDATQQPQAHPQTHGTTSGSPDQVLNGAPAVSNVVKPEKKPEIKFKNNIKYTQIDEIDIV